MDHPDLPFIIIGVLLSAIVLIAGGVLLYIWIKNRNNRHLQKRPKTEANVYATHNQVLNPERTDPPTLTIAVQGEPIYATVDSFRRQYLPGNTDTNTGPDEGLSTSPRNVVSVETNIQQGSISWKLITPTSALRSRLSTPKMMTPSSRDYESAPELYHSTEFANDESPFCDVTALPIRSTSMPILSRAKATQFQGASGGHA